MKERVEGHVQNKKDSVQDALLDISSSKFSFTCVYSTITKRFCNFLISALRKHLFHLKFFYSFQCNNGFSQQEIFVEQISHRQTKNQSCQN